MKATDRLQAVSMLKSALDPQAVYDKIVAPGYDPTKLLSAGAGFADYKGLPMGVPGFLARRYAKSVTPEKIPALRKTVQSFDRTRVLKFIQDNAKLFESAKLKQPASPVA